MATTLVNVQGEGRVFNLLPSAAYTATPNTQQLSGTGRSTAMVVAMNMTAVTATGTVTLKVEGFDPLSGATWPIVTSTAVAATGMTVLKISPGNTPVTNVAVSDILPPVVNITATHGNAVAMTYTLSAHITN